MILDNIALPTPAFSDAPIIAIDLGDRKTCFSSLLSEEDEDI
jgi:hypothetical protein